MSNDVLSQLAILENDLRRAADGTTALAALIRGTKQPAAAPVLDDAKKAEMSRKMSTKKKAWWRKKKAAAVAKAAAPQKNR